MSSFVTRSLKAAALVLGMSTLAGCYGTYNNTSLFYNDPASGMEEVKLLQQYGTPAFATNIEDRKVYSFKVRDNSYIILVGMYNGYDLVVVCRDGLVVETKRVPRPSSFTLFSPLPWAEAD